MPLVKPVLDQAIKTTLNTAFAAAMADFIAVIKTSPLGDPAGAANLTAAVTSSSLIFSNIAGPGISTAVDAYIRSQTITLPPGQAVATAGSPAAQVGATTAPSPPAIIL